MDNHSISIQFPTKPEDGKFILERIHEFNFSKLNFSDDKYFSVFLRNQENDIVGGVVTSVYWSWLFIYLAWVDESLRGKGYGTKLINVAEKKAIELKCHSAWLDTISFQAKPFYEKLGYEIFGQLDNYPPGYNRFFLKKRLID